MPDYKAILSGQSWNAFSSLKTTKAPVFLTYTFNGPQWGSTKFGAADKAMARKALKMWGDSSGIRFIEVKGREAELKFQWKYSWIDASGWAEFPELDRDFFDEGDLARDDRGGSISLNSRYRSELAGSPSFKLYVLLHEIGHAVGLKHPFHKMDHNKQLLKSDLDHVNHTVMSYTGANLNMQPIGLGSLDIQAIRALYGDPSQDGKQVAKWSWSSSKQTLTQIGKSKADVIYGVAVKDIVKGGHGNDKLYGFGGNDTLYGEAGNDVLSGGGDADALYGDIGDDILRGGDDDDTLDGGAGSDVLRGGYGNDVLQGGIGDDNLDGGSGTDILQGGIGHDNLNGGSGADTLQGGSGSDMLAGGGGVDQFVFDTVFNGIDDVDLIMDYDRESDDYYEDDFGDDMIVLSSLIFPTLGVGTLIYGAFVEGKAAEELDDRIIFNFDDQSLSYDPDGSGPTAQLRFAQFQGTTKVTVDHYDILVI